MIVSPDVGALSLVFNQVGLLKVIVKPTLKSFFTTNISIIMYLEAVSEINELGISFLYLIKDCSLGQMFCEIK